MQPVEGQLERGSVIGGYRIDKLIGSGGMGVVYRATNVALNRIYALKVLPPPLASNDQYRERFKREMRLAASLHHPHVVGIHHAGEHDGTLFFAMDFVYGSDLREVLQSGGALDPERAIELLSQVTSALDAAHARGLVHRDVKPANILITVKEGEEWAYLADFGIAKRSDLASDLTATGMAVGTVDYMAPEQISGGRLDARTDVYALGCVFFQMVTGRVPYDRENSIEKLFAHVNEPPPSLEGALAEDFPAFKHVIETAMAKNQEERYLSAGDFARDAAAALKGMRYSGPSASVATGEASPHGKGVTDYLVEPEPAVGRETEAAPPEPAPTQEPEPTPTPGGAATARAAPPTVAAPPGPARTGGSLARYRWPLAALALLIVGGVAAAVALSSGSSTPQGQAFAAAAQPVPTNRVTGNGTATVKLSGDTVSVSVNTNGLLSNAPHAMHIHAGGEGVCPPASAAKLHNGHDSINTGDGLRYYGPPQASLTNYGDTSSKSIIDFPRYPSVGNIRYTRTFAVTPSLANLIRAGNAVIVVHGIDYNGNGIYDDYLGTSDLSKALPAEATAPALCGPLVTAQTSAATSRTYVASLAPYAPAAGNNSVLWLLCHIVGVDAAAAEPTAARPGASTD